ncbi:Gfo/Idh/MocA family oxidoreductase [Streptomyces sp. NPDC005438]|uniref:Gfo/Idh/MocA family oxidoreductase n=1 Tax=Streptomyces sp. NPDC005438 TaxID=3156880 RepID=UPI0033AB472E
MTHPHSSSPLRVGLIGYGLAGSVFHAPLIDSCPDLRLAAVVTANEERARQARSAHGENLRVVADADQLLADPGALDLVVIASPNRTHVSLAHAALAAGVPVVVDKPLAGTAREAWELDAEARKRGLLLSVFQNRRWDSDLLTLRGLLEQGALGTVWRFESRFERWRPRPKGGWRESGDPAEIGGLLYDLGSHLVDQALALFGPVTSVYAESRVLRPGATADDDTFLALTHASGVVSHLWMSATAAQLGPRFRVLGSSGAFVKYGLDPQEARLRAGDRPGEGRPWGEEDPEAYGTLGDLEDTRAVPSVPGAYPAYYEAVARALRQGDPPPVTAAEAARALEVLEAGRLSAHEGRTVPLPGTDAPAVPNE